MTFEFASSVDTATVNALVKAVDPAFSAMATMTEKVVELAMRQNYVYAAWDGIVALICVVILFGGTCIWLANRKEADFAYDGNGAAWLLFWTWIIMGCAAALLTIESCYIVARLVNPEYMAIKDAMAMIRGAAGR